MRRYMRSSQEHLCFPFVLQNTSDFSLVRGESDEIVTEDGRSRCPFDPKYKSTAIMAGTCHCTKSGVRFWFPVVLYVGLNADWFADGELYTGTVSNFQGNEPIIYKSLGPGTALKTENSLNWLQGKIHMCYRREHFILQFILLMDLTPLRFFM